MPSKPYIIDYTTTNTSFLKLAYLLKEQLGIKNYEFHLRLYDRKLRGIDPHSPELSPEMRQRVMLECTINPWYYFRECVYVPDCGGPSRFELNRMNLASFYVALKNQDQYMVSVRQQRRVTSSLVILSWVHLFGSVRSGMCMMDMNRANANHRLELLEDTMRYLPVYMRPTLQNGSDPEKPWHYKYNKALGNTIASPFIPRNNTEMHEYSDKLYFPVHFYNDVEFNKDVFWMAQLSGKNLGEFKTRAAQNKERSFRIVTSEAAYSENRGDAWDAEQFIYHSLKWDDTFYDLTDDELESLLNKNSDNGFIYIEGSMEYLGLPHSWFVDQSRVMNHEPRHIRGQLMLQRYQPTENP